MHLGLLTPETPGHLNPSTTLGRELARRGHCVRVVTSPRVRHKVERAGLELAPIGEQEDADGSSAAAIERLGQLRGIRATLFTGWLLCQAQKQILRDLPEVIAASQFDGLIIDQTMPAAAVTAERLGDRVSARHYLLLCREEAQREGNGLSDDRRRNLALTLAELERERGEQSGTN